MTQPRFSIVLSALAVTLLSTTTGAQPSASPGFGSRVHIAKLNSTFDPAAANFLSGNPTQMAWGPGGRLYVQTQHSGTHSYAYNPDTGTLSDHHVAVKGINGIGLAFQVTAAKTYLYLSTFDGSIYRLSDDDGNDVWGEKSKGETYVRIVTGIPGGDHNLDQIQIAGNTLYIGIGRRTINGRKGVLTSGSLDDFGGKGFWSGGQGNTLGDSAYGGTIGWIQDLTQVPNVEGAANAYADSTITPFLIQQDSSPFTTTAANKLIVHSAGTRNPFGLAFDKTGQLWFTSNFNRTMTNGNGTSGFGYPKDSLGPDFSKDVHDQLFKAAKGADYGYADDNWRGKNPMLTRTAAGYNRVLSFTFDNLFNRGPYQLYDPIFSRDGLGPSSSSDGCDFLYTKNAPPELAGNLFVTRYNGLITEAPGGAGDTIQNNITYSDVVVVNMTTHHTRRVAQGFHSPLAALWDKQQRMLIADYDAGGGQGGIYALKVDGRFDANGDGPADLYFQNPATGALTLWIMDGSTRKSVSALPTPTTEGRLGAVADFNGDGKADLMFQNPTTGALTVWLMDGANVLEIRSINSTPPAGYVLQGANVLLADGLPCLIFRDANGFIYNWLMVGTTAVVYYASLAQLQLTADEVLAGIADLDGDSSSELIIQNLKTGLVTAKRVVSGYVWDYGTLNTLPVGNWRIVGTPDLNGDGKPDLLWQDAITGALRVWYLNGTTRTGFAPLAAVPPTGAKIAGLR